MHQKNPSHREPFTDPLRIPVWADQAPPAVAPPAARQPTPGRRGGRLGPCHPPPARRPTPGRRRREGAGFSIGGRV